MAALSDRMPSSKNPIADVRLLPAGGERPHHDLRMLAALRRMRAALRACARNMHDRADEPSGNYSRPKTG